MTHQALVTVTQYDIQTRMLYFNMLVMWVFACLVMLCRLRRISQTLFLELHSAEEEEYDKTHIVQKRLTSEMLHLHVALQKEAVGNTV